MKLTRELERPMSPPASRGEAWLGICLLALALPFLVHDARWLVHHWNSLWILDVVFSALRHV